LKSKYFRGSAQNLKLKSVGKIYSFSPVCSRDRQQKARILPWEDFGSSSPFLSIMGLFWEKEAAFLEAK
jgi:hypothetical protein